MGKKRKTGEINSSSMADIAFLLLIFFLVTTSMSTSTGLARRLPQPVTDPNQPVTEINKRNLFVVKVNGLNQLLVQGQIIDVKELRAKAKEFIKNENDDPNLPVRVDVQITGLGVMKVTKDHVISLQNDVDTQYQAYINVQNELIAAYNELRDEISTERFGKPFLKLSDDLKESVKALYPANISEAEPKNYGGIK